MDFTATKSPIVILPIASWGKATKKAPAIATQLSKEIKVVHIQVKEHSGKETGERWNEFVAAPAWAAGISIPDLELHQSPNRRLLAPIGEVALREPRKRPHQVIAGAIPELIALVQLLPSQPKTNCSKR